MLRRGLRPGPDAALTVEESIQNDAESGNDAPDSAGSAFRIAHDCGVPVVPIVPVGISDGDPALQPADERVVAQGRCLHGEQVVGTGEVEGDVVHAGLCHQVAAGLGLGQLVHEHLQRPRVHGEEPPLEGFTEAFNKLSPNLVNSLAGQVAGVQITNGSSGVGSSSRIIIRGENSLGGSNQPLFVVDGVPISNEQITSDLVNDGALQEVDYGNGGSELRPHDIASSSI